MSLCDDIFAECEPVFEPIHVFGRDLCVKAMTGRDFGQLQKAVLDFENKQGDEIKSDQELTKAGVAVICLYDARTKERVFPFTDTRSLKAMVNKVADKVSEIDLSAIYRKAAPLSALEETAIEDAEKNSETTPANSGGSESPAKSGA